MNLKQLLYTNISIVCRKQGEALKEYQTTTAKYDLPEEAKAELKKEVFKEVDADALTVKTAGIKAIDAAIQTITEEEAAAPAQRAADQGYMNRLLLKIDMARTVDRNSVNVETMKKYLEEFSNDSMSIAALKSRLPKEFLSAIPEDNTGYRTKHLKVIKVLFSRYMDRAREVYGRSNPNQSEQLIELLTAEVKVFLEYVLLQNEDFSKDDEEILDALALKGESYKTAAGKIKMDIGLLMQNADKLK